MADKMLWRWTTSGVRCLFWFTKVHVP